MLIINDEDREILISALESHLEDVREIHDMSRGYSRDAYAREATKTIDLIDKLKGLT